MHYLGKAYGGEIGLWEEKELNKEHQRPLRAKHRLLEALTQAAQLSDDICQGDVGHAFQLASHSGQRLPAQVPRLDVPRHQWHGGPASGDVQNDEKQPQKEITGKYYSTTNSRHTRVVFFFFFILLSYKMV